MCTYCPLCVAGVCYGCQPFSHFFHPGFQRIQLSTEPRNMPLPTFTSLLACRPGCAFACTFPFGVSSFYWGLCLDRLQSSTVGSASCGRERCNSPISGGNRAKVAKALYLDPIFSVQLLESQANRTWSLLLTLQKWLVLTQNQGWRSTPGAWAMSRTVCVPV